MPDLTTLPPWAITAAALAGWSALAVVFCVLWHRWRSRDARPFDYGCPCGWESHRHARIEDAQAEYVAHVLAEIERVS